MARTSLYSLLGCCCHDYHCHIIAVFQCISCFVTLDFERSRGKFIGCSTASSWHICPLRSGMFMGSSGVWNHGARVYWLHAGVGKERSGLWGAKCCAMSTVFRQKFQKKKTCSMLSLYDSLRNSGDFFSCSQPQHTKFASCMWQMQGSTLTDGQLLHNCHGFVAMSCQTVLEVQQIPCRGASRLSGFETSVQCQPRGWHLVHVSLMFSANQSLFLLFAHGWPCRPIFVSCCSENPYLRLTGSEFPFDSRVRGFAGGALRSWKVMWKVAHEEKRTGAMHV